MKIALLSWESLHGIAVGGVAAHVTELAAALARAGGHEVHLFTRTPGWGTPPHAVIDGVHLHRVGYATHGGDLVADIHSMCAALTAALHASEAHSGGRFDIVHGHDWLTAPAAAAAAADGRRVVFTIHSTEYGRCGNVAHGGDSARVREVESAGLHTAGRVIAVSGALCDEVKEQYGVDGGKLRCVRNGVHAGTWAGTAPDPLGVRAWNGCANGYADPLVVFVGRLVHQKGPDLLLEAVPHVLGRHGGTKFVFAGDGYMRGQLEGRARELGVDHAVRFAGRLDGRPLVELVQTADVVTVPSRNEPFGITVLEAWAAGTPVVATTRGGPRDMVSPGVDGWLVDATVGGVAWGVAEAVADTWRAGEMGGRGRDKAARDYSWDHIAWDTLGVYKELCW